MLKHGEVLSALDEKRARYASDWTTENARRFEAAGDYRWMADHLAGYERVLDIGPGDGRPTAEMLARGHAVVAIDENIGCLMIADERLKSAGFVPHLIEREAGRREVEGGYELAYSEIGAARMPPPGEVVLVEGDFLLDEGLVESLQTIAPFDAVTCWLIGTHQAVHLNRHFRNVNVDQANYRGHLHVRACSVADRLLRHGGILHIVDRATQSAAQFDDAFRHDYAQLASGTSLSLETLSYRAYTEGPSGVEMRVGQGKGKPVEGQERTLVSVLYRKP